MLIKDNMYINNGESVYRSAFKYNGEVLKCGMPRNDILITGNKERESLVKSLLGINPDMKILLYAPTFRDNITSLQSAPLSIHKLLDHLNTNKRMVMPDKSSLGIKGYRC